MRVLVCGGRGYRDGERVCAVLDEIHAATPITVLTVGGAAGADSLAHDWGIARGSWSIGQPGIEVQLCGARWDLHGRRAGPIRNQAMLDLGQDLVVAFPGGRGTADMVRRAKAAGVPVREMT